MILIGPRRAKIFTTLPNLTYLKLKARFTELVPQVYFDFPKAPVRIPPVLDNLWFLFPSLAFITEMREVISIHVGQAGVQIGNACCESPRRVEWR
jgi:hypothetical protein